MSSAPTAVEIANDATWLAQALDAEKGLVRLVRMTPESYRSVSFLDDRIFSQQQESVVVPWAEVAGDAATMERRDARWIFHIGHVGSTLIARLLGELPSVLAIREPRILRDIAGLPFDQRAQFIPALQRLLSRTFATEQFALVKATSFVSDLAPELVSTGERALFVYAKPRTYMASILAGENSLKELSALAPWRAQRMARRVTGLKVSGAAASAAAAWACEMTALKAAADAMPDRHIAWADFDAMLEGMPRELARVADFFSFESANAQLHAIATGPLMDRYSKAPEYEYSPSLRRDLIAEADAVNRAAIDSALAMLRSAAEESPLLARALARAEER